MNDQITIRKANLADVVSIYEIARDNCVMNAEIKKGFISYPLTWQEYANRVLSSNNFYVADDGEVRGSFLCYDNHELDILIARGSLDHESGIIEHISRYKAPFILADQIIAKDHGKNIGTSLMQALFSDMKAEGIENAYAAILYAPIRNIASERFCRKQGFEIINHTCNEDGSVWSIIHKSMKVKG
jgi:GNAT superfamily N-acetyltransferase